MNKRIKKLWVRELKSGKFKQGKGKLSYGNQNGQKRCCLGVLCEIAVKEGVLTRKKAFSDNQLLPYKVQKWAGLDSEDPFITKQNKISAGEANDELGFSFEQIASLINENL